jgi:hypothetical protein
MYRFVAMKEHFNGEVESHAKPRAISVEERYSMLWNMRRGKKQEIEKALPGIRQNYME